MAEQGVTLAELRAQIDSIDRQILALVSDRARCAQRVAEVKQREPGGEDAVVFYRPEREAQVLRRIMEQNPGPLKDEEMARLFREIMSACLALEKPVTAAFAGDEGNFAHEATLKHFGRSVVARAHPGVEDVFRAVEAGAVHYGVVPVETSREGVLGPTLDVFLRSRLRICGEVQVRTHHHLLRAAEAEGEAPRRLFSLPSVFSSCRLWLDEHLPLIERLPVTTYAEAARRARDEPGAAAIAGGHCAECFGLRIGAHNIEDYPDQTARYLVIGQQRIPLSGKDKTSMLVTIRNEPGALYKMLEPLYRHGVSLSRIDSRPSPLGERRCHFFIDVLGHEEHPGFQQAMQDIERNVLDIRLLGAYPEAVL